MKTLTIIVPCFNEEACIPLFYEQVTKALHDKDVDYRVLFVDDGSRDHSLREIKALHEKNAHVLYLSFSKNFGKEAAMLAGLEHVHTDLAVFMDADLQHPCDLLGIMIEKLKDPKIHIAGAWRQGESDPSLLRKWGSMLFAKVSGTTSGATDYRMMDQMAIRALLTCKEVDRYTKGLFDHIGFKTQWIPYENVERQAGTTKWSIKSLFRYAMKDLLSSSAFLEKIFIGLAFFMFTITVFAFIQKDVRFLLFVLIMDGQSGLFALLAFLLQKNLIETKHRPIYFIEEKEI